MDSLLGTLIMAGFVCSAYKNGKRIGSRKGFNVGVSQGRQRKRNSVAEATERGRFQASPCLFLFSYQNSAGTTDAPRGTAEVEPRRKHRHS
jgi:hypothetical protein